MIQGALIKTLTYSDHFSYPLTKEELKLRLIEVKLKNHREFNQALNSLLKSGKVVQTGTYFHLPRRRSIVKLREYKAKAAVPALSRAHDLAVKLGSVPGVLAVYLTGSLAVSNSDSHSDLDFLVITYPRRLWLTRLLLTLYTELNHLRRRPGTDEAPGKICLNLYLSPLSYTIPKAKQSLYTAYELIQAVPLYDPTGTHADLLRSNSWLTAYLPNFKIPRPHKSRQSTSLPTLFSPLTWLEYLAYVLQRAYMSPRLTREYITLNSAFFHPHDPGKSVLTKLTR
jgi:predicted nucleotidyltransferase